MRQLTSLTRPSRRLLTLRVPSSRGVVLALALAFVLSGCAPGDGDIISREGQLRMKGHRLSSGPFTGVSNGGLVLEGSRVCPRIEPISDEAAPVSCFEQSASGSGTLADGCFTIGVGPEAADWTFAPLALEDAAPECAGAELLEDGFSFQPLSSSDVNVTMSAGPLYWARLVEALRGDPLYEGSGFLPALAPDQPVALLAGRPTQLFVSLSDAAERPVAIVTSAAEVVGQETVPARGGVETRITGAPLSPIVRVGQGSLTELALTVDEDRWVLGSVEGVAAADLATLSLEVSYAESEEPAGFRVPVAALAIVTHRDGRRVFGVPVQWDVTAGRLALSPPPVNAPVPDAIWLVDSCRPAPLVDEERRATLHARYQDVDAAIDLEWRVPAGDPNDVTWRSGLGGPWSAAAAGAEPLECQGPDVACSCSSADRRGSALPLLGVLLTLLFVRRRR